MSAIQLPESRKTAATVARPRTHLSLCVQVFALTKPSDIRIEELSVSDFLQTKRDEIAARLRELEPLVTEYRQLEAAAAALAGLPGAARASRPARAARAAATATRRRAAAPRAARTARARKPASGGRRGRPRGSGTRALQTLELVKAKPGITIPEIAAAMGIKQNYLYRVLPGLEKDGKVKKHDRGWHAAG